MRKCILLGVLAVAALVWSASVFAACVPADSEPRDGGAKHGDDRPVGMVYQCTGDGANTIADLNITTVSGQLQAIDVVFKSPAPTSITPAVMTVDGLTVFTGTAVTTPGGRNRPDAPEGLPGGLTISQTGTFDAGDVWWVVLVFL